MSDGKDRHSEFDFLAVADSGERQEYGTGATRDVTTGKGRYDLLSPIALRRLAVHMENGATKYKARNWELGVPLGRFFDSAMRHLFTWLEQKLGGGVLDEEEQEREDHLAAAFWNIHGLLHTEEKVAAGLLPAELDDLAPAKAMIPCCDCGETTHPDVPGHTEGVLCRICAERRLTAMVNEGNTESAKATE